MESPIRRAAHNLRGKLRARAQRAIAPALRKALIAVLGGECEHCHSVENLQIDHVDGNRDWDVRHTDSYTRVARYWHEYATGVPLRALCADCNTKDMVQRRFEFKDRMEEVPF